MSLEVLWWQAHPEVERNFSARWEHSLRFYGQVHLDPWNRLLHILGIPFVWLGSLACVFAPLYGPLWWIGAVSFGLGWILNGIGHIIFEPSSGAYEEGSVDALSVFSSVFWDLSQMKRTLRECRAALAVTAPSPK